MSHSGIRAFQEDIQTKIRNLLAEFSAGKVSNEQFNILYERFNNQLEMTLEVHDGIRQEGQSDVSTIAVRRATTGKATGLAIYHHASETFIEALGIFDLPLEFMSPILSDMSKKRGSHASIDPITGKIEDGTWIVFMTHQFTTAIVIFKNEPSPSQIRELERLLHDFEEVNYPNLNKKAVDTAKLAEPFIGFVRKKLES